MKKTLFSLTMVALLFACGRPSGSNRFSFDGVGEPKVPEGNIVLGKFAGNVELTRWKTPNTGYQSLTGPDLPLAQAIFNSKPIEGLAGLQLLVVYTQPPMKLGDSRLNGGDCYIDAGKFAILGGDLNTVDVGSRFNVEWAPGGAANRQRVIRDPDDLFQDPAADLIFYVSDFDALNPALPYDEDLDINWEGGTLAGRGYAVAPAQAVDSALHFPEDVAGPGGAGEPHLNGAALGANPIPATGAYQIEWEPAAWGEHLVGMNITVQLYGPANLGDAGAPQMADLPYFNRIASLVCMVPDTAGTFTIQQSDLDNLVAVARTTLAYEDSTEDANGDGVCDPMVPGGPGQPAIGEDGNSDGDCDDKIYGAALIINRRTENVFTATLNDGVVPIYFSGNATHFYPMSWAPTE